MIPAPRLLAAALAGLLLLLLLPGAGQATAMPAAADVDVRLIVGMAGGPARVEAAGEALTLLGLLLPPGAEAGAWLYDDRVIPAAPRAPVNAAWRAALRASLQAWESPLDDARTQPDLEAALAAGASQWRSPQHQREVILILSPDRPGAARRPGTERSVKRIIDQALPALHAARVRVHVIIHGGGDSRIGSRLAAATGGLLLRAAETADLAPAVLEVATTIRPARIPVHEGEFIVDGGAGNLILVLPRPADHANLRLRAPDGRILTPNDGKGEVRWQRFGHYLAVAIDEPAKGVWRLDGADGAARIWFDGETGLRVSRLPAHLLYGDAVQLRAEVIDASPAARLIAWHRRPDGGSAAVARARGGVLEIRLPRDLATGTHRIVVELADPGLARLHETRLEVVNSPLHRTETAGRDALRLVPRTDIIRPDGLHVSARARPAPGQPAQPLTTEPLTPLEWAVRLPPGSPAGSVILETAGIRAQGGTLLHRDRQARPEPVRTPVQGAADDGPRHAKATPSRRLGVAMLAGAAAAGMLLLALLVGHRRNPPPPAGASARPDATSPTRSAPEPTPLPAGDGPGSPPVARVPETQNEREPPGRPTTAALGRTAGTRAFDPEAALRDPENLDVSAIELDFGDDPVLEDA